MDELKKLPRKATEETFNELHYPCYRGLFYKE